MADDDDISGRYDKIREALRKVGDIHDDINDHLDHIESRMPTITGGKPLPQPRPRAAGPDAAGNNRSSNAPKVPSIAKQYLGD
jgi:hypothetical protein